MQMTDKPEEVASRRSTIHFAAFPTNDGDETQFFLFVERQVLCYTTSFSKALILWFALHYILNLEYTKEIRDVSLFIQEFVFGLPISASKRCKGGSYLSVTTDIHKFCP